MNHWLDSLKNEMALSEWNASYTNYRVILTNKTLKGRYSSQSHVYMDPEKKCLLRKILQLRFENKGIMNFLFQGVPLWLSRKTLLSSLTRILTTKTGYSLSFYYCTMLDSLCAPKRRIFIAETITSSSVNVYSAFIELSSPQKQEAAKAQHPVTHTNVRQV